MADDQPLKPANILNIVAVNQGKRPLTMQTPKTSPLSPQRVKELLAEGHIIVDARSSASFGAGHIPGSFNVQLASSEFEQRIGWVTPDDAPIILLTNNEKDAQRAIFNMAFIALDTRVVGYIKDGIKGWISSGFQLQTVPQMDVHTLKHKLSTNGLQILDVREDDEWDEGHIRDAHHMRYTAMEDQITLPSQLGTLDISHDQHVAVSCATGKRSSTAISMMLRDGYKHLYNVTGGMEAWEKAGFEMLDVEGKVCKIY